MRGTALIRSWYIDDMKKRVRCENCDAVLEVEEERRYISMHWYYFCRCVHCNSVRTTDSTAALRPPQWERNHQTVTEGNHYALE